jgi:hypothetical protein
MPRYEEVLAALPSFRAHVLRLQQDVIGTSFAFAATGAFSAFATPASNIHATAAGLRIRQGRIIPDDVVLKLFVYDKVAAETLGEYALSEFGGIGVDVEQLPIQEIRTQRDRARPIMAGVSIAPLGANFVGTLGCFVRRKLAQGEQVFALSNNHVLANVDQLPAGTFIVQPGPELPPFVTKPSDIFASLHTTIPIRFPTGETPAINRFDAAMANILDENLIETGAMFESLPYNPSRIAPPFPGMPVVKCGRTTGVTRGIVTAIGVDGIQINYGTKAQPRIAVFDDAIQIVSTTGQPFGLPGDSGSVILEEGTGHPVALLFAGDGFHSTACELVTLCAQLNVMPI